MEEFSVSGNIVDLVARKIYPGITIVSNAWIKSIIPSTNISSQQFFLPGFIDAHVHVESSMLVALEFARLVVSRYCSYSF